MLAGRGGLNLTHGEAFEAFMRRYGSRSDALRAAIEAFPPQKLRAWSEALGQKTFEGTSGRIFPEALKASPLLRAWLRRLADAGVSFAFRHRWIGWDKDGALVFETPKGKSAVTADAVVLALGGASWPRLGSDGGWTEVLKQQGVAIAPLQPANSGFLVPWSDTFRNRFAGTPLKRIAVMAGGVAVRGEAVIADYGIEGGVIYAQSAILRNEILANGKAVAYLSLRPDLGEEEIANRLSAPRGKQSFSNFMRKAINLPPVSTALLHEWAAANGEKLANLPPEGIAALVARFPLTLTGTASIESAISTAGGIPFDEIDEGFMLRKMPGAFVAGEMLDWEAPTGGYLLQACFATGVAAANGAARWLAVR